MALVTSLRAVLGASYALYYRAHSAHWNVEGAQFVSLHHFFGEIASDTYDAIDRLAEDVRQLGAIVPADLTALMREGGTNSTLSDTTDATTLLREVELRNNMLLSKIHGALADAEKEDAGIANHLQERLAAHHKWAWQLTALLKGR